MRSKFSLGGHPLHPMLVTVPIGLFVWALFSDVVYVISDNQTWYDIAFWTGIAAIVTALVAALPGFGDFISMARKSDSQELAVAHMTLNLAVVANYAVAAVLAADDGALDGGRLGAVVALHAVGSGMLLVSGWLGGEMVYRRHLAIIPEDAMVEDAEHRRHDRGRTAQGVKVR